MNKKLIKLAAISSMVLVLAGCNSNNSSTPTSEDVQENTQLTFDTTKEVKITFYHTMGKVLQDVLNKHLPDFYAMYPNITVKHKSMAVLLTGLLRSQ